MHHLEDCLNAGATIDEIMETFKIGVIGGGHLSHHGICHTCFRRIYSKRVVVVRRGKMKRIKHIDVIDRKRVDPETKPLWESMSLKIDSFHYHKMHGAPRGIHE
ncbi:hypothetical protein OJ967_02765 [Peribacillus frigoritolerans]|uniref:hypothetical protein n=1 Tax=Peribacillus frigoritolerans TaxID=450367 RepID=UPI002226D28D|nr:hypothetical protein [Peribacillus frigoritolerans]UYY99492.1 hypothetical protein OJ967_02765 [Peribacillus frigoritolerans]